MIGFTLQHGRRDVTLKRSFVTVVVARATLSPLKGTLITGHITEFIR